MTDIVHDNADALVLIPTQHRDMNVVAMMDKRRGLDCDVGTFRH